MSFNKQDLKEEIYRIEDKAKYFLNSFVIIWSSLIFFIIQAKVFNNVNLLEDFNIILTDFTSMLNWLILLFIFATFIEIFITIYTLLNLYLNNSKEISIKDKEESLKNSVALGVITSCSLIIILFVIPSLYNFNNDYNSFKEITNVIIIFTLLLILFNGIPLYYFIKGFKENKKRDLFFYIQRISETLIFAFIPLNIIFNNLDGSLYGKTYFFLLSCAIYYIFFKILTIIFKKSINQTI